MFKLLHQLRLCAYLIDSCSREINIVQPSGPLAIGGWSLGGVIALEMAQQLRKQGRSDILLVNIDGEIENTDAHTSRLNPLYWTGLAKNFIPWAAHEDFLKSGAVLSIPRRISAKTLGSIKKRYALMRYGKGTASNVAGFVDRTKYSPQAMAFITAANEASFVYKPKPYSGPVIVYEATVGPLMRLPEISKTWRSIASELESVRIEGTHASLLNGKGGARLGKHLQERMEKFTHQCGEGALKFSPQ